MKSISDVTKPVIKNDCQSQTNQESSKTTVESEGLLNTSFDYAENQAKIERMEKDSKAFRKNLTEAKMLSLTAGDF